MTRREWRTTASVLLGRLGPFRMRDLREPSEKLVEYYAGLAVSDAARDGRPMTDRDVRLLKAALRAEARSEWRIKAEVRTGGRATIERAGTG